jgi:hypothetical protein
MSLFGNRRMLRALGFVMFSGLIAVFSACGGGGSSGVPVAVSGPTAPPITIPTMNPVPEASLVFTSDQGIILSQAGQTFQFTLGVKSPTGNVTPATGASWQSLNAAVATVDQTGKVTVTGALGSAVIVANLAPYDPVYASVVVAHSTPQTVQIPSALVKSATPTSAVLIRTAQTQSLLPGAIVVSGSAGGLFGQVTGVQMDSSTVTLSLQQTTIPAAFPDYSYSWNGPPIQLTVQSRGGRYTVSDRRGRVIAQGITVVRCSGTAVTVTELPDFSYPVSVKPIFEFDASRRFVRIGAEASGTVSFAGGSYATTGSVDSPVSCAATINLQSHVQIEVADLLVAAPAISASVGVDLKSDRAVVVRGPTATTRFDILTGIQYQAGQWSLLSNQSPPSFTGQGSPPQVTADGPIGVTLSPFFKADVGFDVCPFVCITTPFDDTLFNGNIAFARIFSDYDVSLTGTTNELAQGYQGPMFSTAAGAEAGFEISLDFAVLDGLLKHINITPLSLPLKTYTVKQTPFTAPSMRVTASTSVAKAGEAVTLTASASGYTTPRVRFVGFLNGATTGTVLTSATLDGSGTASNTWTPSAAGQYTIVALLDNVVWLPTASNNSVSVAISAVSTPQPTPTPPTTPQPTPTPPITPQPTPTPAITPQPTPTPPITPQPTPTPPITPQPTPTPTITPRPTPQPTPTPRSATVANTGGSGLHIRSSPSIDASVIATMPDGTQTAILGGPSVVNGYTWWNVRATVNGTQYTGWSGIGEWLSPPPSVGSVVTVSYTSGKGLELHSTTSTTSTVVKALPEGTQMNVIGGPVASEGYVWWNLRGIVGGTQYTGWSATGPWLVPNPRY